MKGLEVLKKNVLELEVWFYEVLQEQDGSLSI